MAYINSTRAVDFGIFHRLNAMVGVVRTALKRRSIFLQTVRELQNLDNRELADIGINRTDIHSIAMDAAFDPNRK